ncbi:phage tail terminator family protein [Clostridium sp. Marseille-P2415]|uniref:phage tail terminator family protein n=1 Tax=Clostridium sp. Marseille-P2415 TaxID=1805471 RepID=UPI00098886A6|nr:hypothetical protein [Clostridium sp. Marseille-P2415]
MYNEIMVAVVGTLKELFPEAEIGTNTWGDGIEKPYFEVGLLETSEKSVNGRRYFRSINMYVKYYPQNSQLRSSDLNLVLDILMDKLEYLSLENGSLIRGSSRSGKNEGGILNFLVDYHVYFIKTNEPEESMEEIRLK